MASSIGASATKKVTKTLDDEAVASNPYATPKFELPKSQVYGDPSSGFADIYEKYQGQGGAEEQAAIQKRMTELWNKNQFPSFPTQSTFQGSNVYPGQSVGLGGGTTAEDALTAQWQDRLRMMEAQQEQRGREDAGLQQLYAMMQGIGQGVPSATDTAQRLTGASEQAYNQQQGQYGQTDQATQQALMQTLQGQGQAQNWIGQQAVSGLQDQQGRNQQLQGLQGQLQGIMGGISTEAAPELGQLQQQSQAMAGGRDQALTGLQGQIGQMTGPEGKLDQLAVQSADAYQQRTQALQSTMDKVNAIPQLTDLNKTEALAEWETKTKEALADFQNNTAVALQNERLSTQATLDSETEQIIAEARAKGVDPNSDPQTLARLRQARLTTAGQLGNTAAQLQMSYSTSKAQYQQAYDTIGAQLRQHYDDALLQAREFVGSAGLQAAGEMRLSAGQAVSEGLGIEGKRLEGTALSAQVEQERRLSQGQAMGEQTGLEGMKETQRRTGQGLQLQGAELGRGLAETQRASDALTSQEQQNLISLFGNSLTAETAAHYQAVNAMLSTAEGRRAAEALRVQEQLMAEQQKQSVLTTAQQFQMLGSSNIAQYLQSMSTVYAPFADIIAEAYQVSQQEYQQQDAYDDALSAAFKLTFGKSAEERSDEMISGEALTAGGGSSQSSGSSGGGGGGGGMNFLIGNMGSPLGANPTQPRYSQATPSSDGSQWATDQWSKGAGIA